MAPLPAANLKISGSFDKSPKKTAGTGGKSTPKPSGGSGTSGGPPPDGPSSSPAPKTGAEDVILSWDKPNAYVGPAEEYIIEYAPAGTPKDSDEWKRYDDPKKYKDTQVKLEEDKLPASVDVVFRVKAVHNDNGDEKVGDPSEPTKAGSLKMPSRGTLLRHVFIVLTRVEIGPYRFYIDSLKPGGRNEIAQNLALN